MSPTLAWELGLTSTCGRNCLYASRLNRLQNASHRVDEICAFLQSTCAVKIVRLDEPPIQGELGRGVCRAITANAHVETIILCPHAYAVMRDLMCWISSVDDSSLAHMTSLVMIDMHGADLMSAQDWKAHFQLFRTCPNLQELHVYFSMTCHDGDVIPALSQYLRDSSSLIKFTLLGCIAMSESAFGMLCHGIASSGSLRSLTLGCDVIDKQHIATAAECLARAISNSASLEQVHCSIPRWALSNTTPIYNLDFSFQEVDGTDHWTRFRIERKWKGLLSAEIPVGLWGTILEKAHAQVESSHGREGILYLLLREKPNLVTVTTLLWKQCSCGPGNTQPRVP